MTPDRLQYDLYRIAAPMVAIALGFLLAASLRAGRRHRPEARIYSVYTAATIGYLASNSLEICSTGIQAAMFWSRLIYLFIGFLPIIWMEFCLRFTRAGRGMNKAVMAALVLIPLSTLVVIFTDGLQPLMWPSITWVSQDPYLISVRQLGPWFVVYAAYAYALYLVGAFIVVRAFILYRQYYRRQAVFIIAAITVPLLASMNYVFKLVPGLVKDFTPLGYAAASALLYAGLFRRDLFACSPVARSLVVERMREGLLVLDRNANILDANPVALEILGLAEADLGRPLGGLPATCREEAGTAQAEDNGAAGAGSGATEAGSGDSASGKHACLHARQAVVEALEMASPREFFLLRGSEPRWYRAEAIGLGMGAEGSLVTIQDQTETKVLLNRIAELASTDELTRLPNRRSFMREAARELSRAQRHGLKLAVAMFDLDRFKLINDTYGHHTGDVALQAFGRILIEESRGEDFAGRIGGEEFAMVFVGAEGGGAYTFCERIRARLELTEILDEGGQRVKATVSVGYALLGRDQVDVEVLLSRADKALYAAKEKGRNRVEVWEPEDPLSTGAPDL